MHNCNYCHKPFVPRPQVKFPKACKQLNCQKKRQRDNERAWHARCGGKFDRKYHNNRRKYRKKLIETYLRKLLEALKAGLLFLGYSFSEGQWVGFLQEPFRRLGLRRINKLWQFKI